MKLLITIIRSDYDYFIFYALIGFGVTGTSVIIDLSKVYISFGDVGAEHIYIYYVHNTSVQY